MKLNQLYRLKNSIQHYSWGSRDALEIVFGIANPANEPQAEIWMGAHPKSPSLLKWNKEYIFRWMSWFRSMVMQFWEKALLVSLVEATVFV